MLVTRAAIPATAPQASHRARSTAGITLADQQMDAGEFDVEIDVEGPIGDRDISRFGAEETFGDLDGTMAALCYPIDFTSTEGDTPAAFGNRIGQAVIDAKSGSVEGTGF